MNLLFFYVSLFGAAYLYVWHYIFDIIISQKIYGNHYSAIMLYYREGREGKI